MATPFTNVSGDANRAAEDSSNFYHSQLRIRVECCFGMLVQRWGILRMRMRHGLSIKKIIAMINALAKLHNFCIGEMVNWNAPTGGDLLQGCFSMGYALGKYLNKEHQI